MVLFTFPSFKSPFPHYPSTFHLFYFSFSHLFFVHSLLMWPRGRRGSQSPLYGLLTTILFLYWYALILRDTPVLTCTIDVSLYLFWSVLQEVGKLSWMYIVPESFVGISLWAFQIHFSDWHKLFFATQYFLTPFLTLLHHY